MFLCGRKGELWEEWPANEWPVKWVLIHRHWDWGNWVPLFLPVDIPCNRLRKIMPHLQLLVGSSDMEVKFAMEFRHARWVEVGTLKQQPVLHSTLISRSFLWALHYLFHGFIMFWIFVVVAAVLEEYWTTSSNTQGTCGARHTCGKKQNLICEGLYLPLSSWGIP